MYVLLGMLIYSFFIPVLDQFTTIVIQWLENIKGQQVIKAQQLKNKLVVLENEEESTTTPETVTNVIGFQMPEEINYYEEDYEEDD